jgi:D-alanine-D-alanine ligase
VTSGRRIRVGVIAGGASAERAISLATGIQIAQHLPADRYDVVLVDPLALMSRNRQLSDEQRAHARRLAERAGVIDELTPSDRRELPPPLQHQIERAAAGLVPATNVLLPVAAERPIDVAFVAIHGQWGEDGTIQGMLELLGIPYVGSGVLASALAMDKVMAKAVLAAAGLDVPRGFAVSASGGEAARAQAVDQAESIGYPVVVKPVRQGSSFGITMVERSDQLLAAIGEALAYDDRVLVEERVAGTELTVGIIGNEPELVVLPVVEIVTSRSFFDYRAKYDPQLSDEICPARIDDELARRVQELARRAHRTLGCRDLSRTDFIVTHDGRPWLLEVNTIPGMTANSLLPKAAQAAGIPFGELCSLLVELALRRAEHRPSRARPGTEPG